MFFIVAVLNKEFCQKLGKGFKKFLITQIMCPVSYLFFGQINSSFLVSTLSIELSELFLGTCPAKE